ncbi:thiamine pyrophosphate-dependent enzyme, partial [Streptomyces nodosus]
LYQRAQGFGFPGVRVDGNDVLACLAVTRWALAAAMPVLLGALEREGVAVASATVARPSLDDVYLRYAGPPGARRPPAAAAAVRPAADAAARPGPPCLDQDVHDRAGGVLAVPAVRRRPPYGVDGRRRPGRPGRRQP